MNIETKIYKYYCNIVINKPNYIEVKNSYERYCVYKALEKYASNWQSIWFNKSYKKEIKYALNDTCKYCFKKKNNAEKITIWEEDDYETYCGGKSHYKCNTCGDIYAKIWGKNDVMFI
jgi:hypothetical protein